jgi:hypothetical protein
MGDTMGHPVLFQASTIKTITKKREQERGKTYAERIFKVHIKLEASGKLHVSVDQNFVKEPCKFNLFLGPKQEINLEAPSTRSRDLTIPTKKNRSDRKSDIQPALMEFRETVGPHAAPDLQ